MKKIISVILTLVLSVAFIACSRANYSEPTFYVTEISDGAVITNASGTDCKATVIVAEYDDDGILTKVTTQTIHLEENEEKNITFTGGNIHKVFIWDSANGIIQCGFTNKENSAYKIDYCGQETCYTAAKDKYIAGEKVVLYYTLIATDTNYHFYLNNEEINPDYEEGKGYIISFIMPPHDVKLECKSKNTMIDIPEDDDIILVDYCRKTIATVGGDGYYEIVLYYYSDTEVKLSIYQWYEGDDEESCVNYVVPYEVVDKCYDIIKKNKLKEWNKRYDDVGIGGGVTVCKFRDDDGTYIRVSTDAMPDNGKDILSQIRQTMESYIKEEYKQ